LRVLAFAIALCPNAAAAQQVLPEIVVISTSPFGGTGIDRDKVPALAQTVTADDFARSYGAPITETLFQRIPGVSTSDQQGNSFQTDIRYRGFVASPVPGQPQGLAVYMNGVRINEAFGDTVNFDFIPTNAIGRADIQSNNPVFGLNALGGAINLQMKNGFTFQGFEGEFQFGARRLNGGVQYGVQQAMSPPMWRCRASTTAAGATSPRRGSRGFTPTSAGAMTAMKCTSWCPAPRISSASWPQPRSSCCSATGPRSTPGRRRRRTRPR
jgi:outer membrane cobalamin receptor